MYKAEHGFCPRELAAGSVLIFSFVILEGNSSVGAEDKNTGIMQCVCVVLCFLIKHLLKAWSFSAAPGWILCDNH